MASKNYATKKKSTEPDGYYKGKPYWVNDRAKKDLFSSYERIATCSNKEFNEFLNMERTALTMRRSCCYSPYGRHYMSGF